MDPHVTLQLSALMDGELDARERDLVEGHLRACPACARHLEELRAVDKAARELPVHAPDGYFEAFPERLRARLERGRTGRRGLAPSWALAAAAAVALAVFTPRLLRDSRPPARAGLEGPPATAAPGTAATPPATAAPMPAVKPAAPAPAEAARKESANRMAEATVPRDEHAQRPAPSAGARAKRDQPSQSYAPPPPPQAREADRVQTLADAATPAEERDAPAAPVLKAEAETAGAAEEQKARRDPAVGGVAAAPGRAAATGPKDGPFALLRQRTASSAEEARALREAWRAYARQHGGGPHADDARVGVVEAGALAWRLGGVEADRVQAQEDARAYLDRPDARQAARVRQALESLKP
jgi:anti-sigma factor RsiW